jgi:hypothetical protein
MDRKRPHHLRLVRPGEPVEKIVVRPDQISQRDPRPLREIRLGQVVVRFLALSAVFVACSVGLVIVALRLAAG